ncbi:uncharacterized protein LOC109832660 [Asparagus officinalis]|uniref:uncharacterized protein LOC109832660 n=1 Tax=Asparagus officinalis TaxID=4686 RepID=UPI00098E7233|nr:uncharacterized protein LOC109832660 [Asparagus officinalis]
METVVLPSAVNLGLLTCAAAEAPWPPVSSPPSPPLTSQQRIHLGFRHRSNLNMKRFNRAKTIPSQWMLMMMKMGMKRGVMMETMGRVKRMHQRKKEKDTKSLTIPMAKRRQVGMLVEKKTERTRKSLKTKRMAMTMTTTTMTMMMMEVMMRKKW